MSKHSLTTAQNGSKGQILLLILCLLLLLSSGRMDSGDANAQLQASFNLVQTGSLGADTPFADREVQNLYVKSPGGRYFEAHDIGNSLLMVPPAAAAALAASATHHLSSRDMIAKVLVSLMDTVVSGIGCFYLYLLLGLFYRSRTALILTAVFAFASLYTAYFRAAWDVVPACNVMLILLYYSARAVLAPAIRVRESLPIALSFGVLSMFRFSVAPFIGLSLLILLWSQRRKITGSALVTAVIAAVALLAPSLVFNMIRTGSPLRSAATLPQFHDQNGLTNPLWKGMIGLLFSPNRGLFFYSPILLLLILLPFFWNAIPRGARTVLGAFSPGIVLYYLMISKMQNWGAAGWGPRYLVPVLPLLFLGAAVVAFQAWNSGAVGRFLTVSLGVLAFVLAMPTLLVNYSNAVQQYPDPYSETTLYPIQHIAVWKNLGEGVRHGAIAPRPNAKTDSTSKLAFVFPDLLVMRVHAVVSGRSRAAGAILLLLYVAALGGIIFLLWRSTDRDSVPENKLEAMVL